MYTALVHTWYEDAAVNTAGFYWEEGHRCYKVVESDVLGLRSLIASLHQNQKERNTVYTV